jgi:phosphodiesterase/alkaline phosphatase D-like protein
VHLDSLHYAVFSCSSWAWGYFNAFGAAARRSAVHRRLDFWLHVGDYFYEDGQEQPYPRADQAVRWTGLQPATETLTLRDYRLRHALTRTDVDLQAISEAAPLIAVWDDHEITNDPWVGGAQAHNPENGEGDWWVRKRAAVKAYHEWMPTRIEPPPACTTNAASVAASAAEISMCTGTHEGERIYRQFRFGTLAALFGIRAPATAETPPAFRIMNHTPAAERSLAEAHVVAELLLEHMTLKLLPKRTHVAESAADELVVVVEMAAP